VHELDDFDSHSDMKKVLGLSALAASALLVIGCGGNSASTSTPNAADLLGGVATGSGTATSTIDATSGSVIITTPSGSVVGELPTGLVLPVGGGYAIVPAATPLFTSLSLNSKSPGDVYTSIDGGATYTIAQTKVVNRTIGALSQGLQFTTPLVIPAGKNIRIKMEGPFVIGNSQYRLDISSSLVIGIATTSGTSGTTTSSLPAKVAGKIPVNGTKTTQSTAFVKVTADTAFDGKSFTLKIVHSNGTLEKTVKQVSGVSRFDDFADENGNSNIPSDGVQSVQLIFNN
jgi:hypothetical protein